MNGLIALVFKTTNLANELSIGETVLLSRHGDEYVLWDGTNYYGYQLHRYSEEADGLVDYVSHQFGSNIIVWDEQYSAYLQDTMVEIVGITGNYIVAKPNATVQELLLSDLEQYTAETCAENLASFTEYFSEALGLCPEENECSCEGCDVGCYPVEEKKEETSMFSGLGSSFGKINTDQFRLSINGLAVRGKEGKYVTFNPETRELVEVTTGFFDEMRDLLFVMPAKELEVGDIILHQDKPYYITVANDNVVKGIDFEEATENTLVPKTNVFGIKYFTKVFNCLGTNNILGSDIASNPMMAYALMGGKDFDLSKIMMFQALSGQGNGVADFSENPIMLMALMSNERGGGDISDFAKMQILSQISGNKKKETKKSTTKEN